MVGFVDEPDGINDFDDIPVSESKIQFEGLKTATTKAERRRERRRRRNERTGMIAACCILVCIIIGVTLAYTLEKETEHILYGDSLLDVSESPTTFPTTTAPIEPTTNVPTPAPHPTFSVATPVPTTESQKDYHKPTLSPTTPLPTSIMVEEYMFYPDADTYIHLDGSKKGQVFGHEDTLWVQRGTIKETQDQEIVIPNIVGILQFDTTNLPNRKRWPDDGEVTLRIQHVPKDKYPDAEEGELEAEDILPVKMEVYRLPNNYDIVVESLTGDDFHNAPKHVTDGMLLGTHSIDSTDTSIEIDITTGVYDGIDGQPLNTTMYPDDQMMFLLKINWEEPPHHGNQFRTRESKRKPELIFSNMA